MSNVDFLSVYHVPEFECGNNHYLTASYQSQVTCVDCLKLLEVGGYGYAALRCKCGGVLIKRKNSRDGSEFYGCNNYPNCKETLSMEVFYAILDAKKRRKDGKRL